MNASTSIVSLVNPLRISSPHNKPAACKNSCQPLTHTPPPVFFLTRHSSPPRPAAQVPEWVTIDNSEGIQYAGSSIYVNGKGRTRFAEPEPGSLGWQRGLEGIYRHGDGGGVYFGSGNGGKNKGPKFNGTVKVILAGGAVVVFVAGAREAFVYPVGSSDQFVTELSPGCCGKEHDITNPFYIWYWTFKTKNEREPYPLEIEYYFWWYDRFLAENGKDPTQEDWDNRERFSSLTTD